MFSLKVNNFLSTLIKIENCGKTLKNVRLVSYNKSTMVPTLGKQVQKSDKKVF